LDDDRDEQELDEHEGDVHERIEDEIPGIPEYKVVQEIYKGRQDDQRHAEQDLF